MANSTIPMAQFITEDFFKSGVEVAANSNADADFTVAKTGFTALGAVLINKTGSGSGVCVITGYTFLSNGNLRINFRNISSSAASLNVGCRVLYQRV